MKNYYEILEVNKNASKEVIERAYKVLVKKYHPDLYDTSEKAYVEQKLKDINEAYKVLSNDFLRRQYDLECEKQQEVFDKRNIVDQTTKEENRRDKNKKNSRKEKNRSDSTEEYKVGSFASLIELTKQIFSNRAKLQRVKKDEETKRKDRLALGLTIAIMLILGVICWFIPVTNAWIRDMLFFIK